MTFKTAIYLSSACIVIPFVAYLTNFSGGVSPQTSDWANFGSFLGGIISSIFSFLSFIMVLLIYYNSQLEKSEKEIEDRIFKYIELLNSNFNKIRVSFNSQTTIGNDVFSRFNGAVFKAFSDAPQLSNSEIQGLMLQNSFFKNSIIEYIDLVVVILNYIDKKGGTKKEDFLTILLSQLSEQQKASFAILKHNQLLDFFDFKQKAFLDTPVDAYIKLGEKMSAFKFEN